MPALVILWYNRFVLQSKLKPSIKIHWLYSKHRFSKDKVILLVFINSKINLNGISVFQKKYKEY